MLGLWEEGFFCRFLWGFLLRWLFFFFSPALSENDHFICDSFSNFRPPSQALLLRSSWSALWFVKNLFAVDSQSVCWMYVTDIHSFEGSVSVKDLCELHFLQVCHQSCSWLIQELPTCKAALLSHNQHIHAQNYSQICVCRCSHPLFSSSVDFIQ